MKVRNLLGGFLFNLVFFTLLHAQAQTLTGAVQLRYDFLDGQRLLYDFPMQGKASILYASSTGNKTLIEGDLNSISVNPGSDLDKSGEPLTINGKPISRLNFSGVNVGVVRVGESIFVVDNDGDLFPFPTGKDKISWSGHWVLQTYLNADNEPFHVLMNDNNGTVVTLVIRARASTYATFSFPNTKESPFNFEKFSVGFSKKGNLAFIDEKGEPVTDSTGKRLPIIRIPAMRRLATPVLDSTEPPQEIETSTALVPVSKVRDITPRNQSNNTTNNATYDNLKNIKAWLDRTVIGQPELIQGLYDLEVKNAVYGYRRDRPEVIMMMGLPGTGKDTAAESYVDAIYGKVGAHREHMYRLPILKRAGDVWSLEGSPTGYMGSDNITPFIKWLVAHAGGRYKLSGGGKSVEENPDWKPGMVLDGYQAPEKSVVFANEFHDWAKEEKDSFLKQAVEKGYFDINNPGGGVSKIYVPVTFILASNEGINLVAPRKGNGERAGKALTYAQLLANWQATHNNDQLLRREIMRTNGQESGGAKAEGAPGISEELLDRIPSANIFLLRPLSPADLQIIAQQKLQDLQTKFQNTLSLQWNPDLVKVIQTYQYDAEKNARPMEARVSKLIEETILRAVTEGKISVTPPKKNIVLDIIKNPDNTMSLVITGDYNLTLPIVATEGDKAVPLQSDDDIAQLLTLSSRLKKHVFGADDVADDVGQDILVSDEGHQSQRDIEKATEPARSYMFLGPSSTGKTEMAKAIAQEYLGSESNMTTFDFSQVRSVEDLKVKILGTRDGLGNPSASDFMREYDAHQGRLVVVLDELANAPKDVLKALYDVLREPVVRTFSDGIPRAMSGVILVMTGNAGEEWYQDIPRSIPVAEQEAAMEDIYKMAMADPDFRRRTLEKYFSEAFINRVGERNIYFFSPLSFKAIRELAQLKLLQALQRLQTAESRRDWNVVFASKDDYVKTLETIENEGFVLREQGASIDRFVKQDIEGNLRFFLLANKIPNGATVILRRADEKIDKQNVFFQVSVQSPGFKTPQDLYFKIVRRVTPSYPKVNQEDQIITAFHEAGHELVRHVLMGDKYKAKLITIQPGVTQIDDHWIRYLGLTSQEQQVQFQMTREAVVRDMAAMAAGGIAQSIVTQGSINDAGQSNDMERATALAQVAILKWGLSPVWGNESIPPKMTLQDYLNSLSAEKRKIYEQEVNKLLDEARSMAKSVLLTNMESGFIPLALELAAKGTLDADAMEAFYKIHDGQLDKVSYQQAMTSPEKIKTLESQWIVPATSTSMDGKLSPKIPRPASVANIDEIIAAKKAAEVALVALPDKLPIAATPLLLPPASPVGGAVDRSTASDGDGSGNDTSQPDVATTSGPACQTLLNF